MFIGTMVTVGGGAWGHLLAEQAGILRCGRGRAVRGGGGDIGKEWLVSFGAVLDELYCLITDSIGKIVLGIIITVLLFHALI